MINRDNYRFVYEDVMKQLDKLENEYLPQVKLEITEVSDRGHNWGQKLGYNLGVSNWDIIMGSAIGT